MSTFKSYSRPIYFSLLTSKPFSRVHSMEGSPEKISPLCDHHSLLCLLPLLILPQTRTVPSHSCGGLPSSCAICLVPLRIHVTFSPLLFFKCQRRGDQANLLMYWLCSHLLHWMGMGVQVTLLHTAACLPASLPSPEFADILLERKYCSLLKPHHSRGRWKWFALLFPSFHL